MENIEWWRKINRIDGSTLEWQTHEPDNAALRANSISEFEKFLMSDRYDNAKPLGFCFNPPISRRLFGGNSSKDIGIVCITADDNIFWFHINKAVGQHWIRQAGGTDEDIIG